MDYKTGLLVCEHVDDHVDVEGEEHEEVAALGGVGQGHISQQGPGKDIGQFAL